VASAWAVCPEAFRAAAARSRQCFGSVRSALIGPIVRSDCTSPSATEHHGQRFIKTSLTTSSAKRATRRRYRLFSENESSDGAGRCKFVITPLPSPLPMSRHRRSVWVLDLDPVPRRTGSVGSQSVVSSAAAAKAAARARHVLRPSVTIYALLVRTDGLGSRTGALHRTR
jgi:hypothetical protein